MDEFKTLLQRHNFDINEKEKIYEFIAIVEAYDELSRKISSFSREDIFDDIINQEFYLKPIIKSEQL